MTTETVNQVVADARSLPELVRGFERTSPDLAKSIEGKSLIASRTPWGVLLAGAIGWAAARYGLGWDSNTVDLVAGLAVLAGGYAMRYVTTGPIRGLLVHQSVKTSS